MSIFVQDIKELFSNAVLETVTKIITEKEKVTDKPKGKTDIYTTPQLNGVGGQQDNDNDDNSTKIVKKKSNKKTSVSEHIDVTFSDKEIEFFDKVLNNTEGK